MKKVSLNEALGIAEKLGIDFSKAGFTPEEFLEGMNIELEHGLVDPATNVTNDDLLITGKIALAHLNEVPIYYNEDIGLCLRCKQSGGDQTKLCSYCSELWESGYSSQFSRSECTTTRRRCYRRSLGQGFGN